jgi:hypothetical protein
MADSNAQPRTPSGLVSPPQAQTPHTILVPNMPNLGQQQPPVPSAGTPKLRRSHNRRATQAQPFSQPDDVARHIANGEDYRVAIKNHLKNNPNLRNKDWKIPNDYRETFVPESRVKVFTFHQDRLASGADLTSVRELKLHLLNPPLNKAGRLYVLEGTNPEFVETFGSQFDIDPAFFSRHQRTALWEQRHNGGNTSKLASSHDPKEGFFMEYCELLYFGSIPESGSLRNPSDMRHINVARKPL